MLQMGNTHSCLSAIQLPELWCVWYCLSSLHWQIGTFSSNSAHFNWQPLYFINYDEIMWMSELFGFYALTPNRIDQMLSNETLTFDSKLNFTQCAINEIENNNAFFGFYDLVFHQIYINFRSFCHLIAPFLMDIVAARAMVFHTLFNLNDGILYEHPQSTHSNNNLCTWSKKPFNFSAMTSGHLNYKLSITKPRPIWFAHAIK